MVLGEEFISIKKGGVSMDSKLDFFYRYFGKPKTETKYRPEDFIPSYEDTTSYSIENDWNIQRIEPDSLDPFNILKTRLSY